MNENQYFPISYRSDGEGRFLPFLAGLAITAPLWAGGFFGRRCCPPFFGPFAYPYPLPTPFPYPYPLPSPYTFNTYQGVVGSPYSYYYRRPYTYF